MANQVRPIVITTTSDNREKLLELATKLVEDGLVACAQVASTPITSIYQWEGKTETSEEFVLTIKTIERHFKAVEKTIHELHNYDVPQIVAVEVVEIGTEYQKWLVGSVTN